MQGGSDAISLEIDAKLEENPQVVADTFVNYLNTMWDNKKECEGERTEKENVSKVSEKNWRVTAVLLIQRKILMRQVCLLIGH